jgi:hypothetical protein
VAFLGLARERQADRRRNRARDPLLPIPSARFHRRGLILTRKTRRAAVATSERAAPIRKAVFGPKSFHQIPKKDRRGERGQPDRAVEDAESATAQLSLGEVGDQRPLGSSVAAKKRA